MTHYEVHNDAIKRQQHHYRKPKKGEKGEYLIVSIILHKLDLKYKSLKEDKSNYQKLGRYLMRQSFKHKKMNYGSVYYVKSN